MAIKLNAAYSKKLGLPNFSSHSFSASVEVELTDPGTIAAETARLYATLQTSVDNEIRQTGYLPGAESQPAPQAQKGVNTPATENGSHSNNGNHPDSATYNCSPKQQKLIADLAAELGLAESDLDNRSERLFDKPAHRLDKLGASGLISSLLAEAGTRRQRNGNGNGPSSNGSQRRSVAGAHRNGGGA